MEHSLESLYTRHSYVPSNSDSCHGTVKTVAACMVVTPHLGCPGVGPGHGVPVPVDRGHPGEAGILVLDGGAVQAGVGEAAAVPGVVRHVAAVQRGVRAEAAQLQVRLLRALAHAALAHVTRPVRPPAWPQSLLDMSR